MDLNRLNLKILSRLNTFQKKDVVLDYDNTLLFSEKADARFTYKKVKGYSPGVGMIGKHVVYVEIAMEIVLPIFCRIKQLSEWLNY